MPDAVPLAPLVLGDPQGPLLAASNLPSAAWVGLLRQAQDERVLTLLARRLTASGAAPDVPEDVRAALRAVRLREVAGQLRLLAGLDTARTALDGAGVPWLVFKGPALAALAYEHPGDRVYGDLDLLVAPADLGPALEALEGTGARLLDGNWRITREMDRGELTVLLTSGVPVDLHWHVLNDPRVRARWHLPTDALLDARRPVVVPDLGDVPTLSKPDTLVHACVHLVLDGATGLGPLLDVHNLARTEEDWPRVVSRAEESGTALAAAVALDRAQEATGEQVAPREVLARLGAQSPWARGLRALARAVPPAERTGGHSGRTAVRATRRGTADSLAALARLTWSEAVLDRLRPHRHDRLVEDFRQPVPAHERDAFLRDLALRFPRRPRPTAAAG